MGILLSFHRLLPPPKTLLLNFTLHTMSKPNISTLRKIASRLGFSAFYNGRNWTLTNDVTAILPHTVFCERDALIIGLKNAKTAGLLNVEEEYLVDAS